MIRKQIYMTKKEIDAIKILAKKTNVSDSEYIRRMLDAQMNTTYFISYRHRERGRYDQPWFFCEVISEIHPIEWLVKTRNTGRNTDFFINFWSQVSKVDASKL